MLRITHTATNAAPREHETPRVFHRVVLVSMFSWHALGCSGEQPALPGTFGDEPAAIEESKERLFAISLYSSPTHVPVRGENHVRLHVTPLNDAGGAVLPSLVTFMPAMGHGSGVDPNLTEIEGHVFTFEDVVLNMPGRWELRLELESESHDGSTSTDNAVFEFDVD